MSEDANGFNEWNEWHRITMVAEGEAATPEHGLPQKSGNSSPAAWGSLCLAWKPPRPPPFADEHGKSMFAKVSDYWEHGKLVQNIVLRTISINTEYTGIKPYIKKWFYGEAYKFGYLWGGNFPIDPPSHTYFLMIITQIKKVGGGQFTFVQPVLVSI